MTRHYSTVFAWYSFSNIHSNVDWMGVLECNKKLVVRNRILSNETLHELWIIQYPYQGTKRTQNISDYFNANIGIIFFSQNTEKPTSRQSHHTHLISLLIIWIGLFPMGRSQNWHQKQPGVSKMVVYWPNNTILLVVWDLLRSVPPLLTTNTRYATIETIEPKL